MNKVWLAAVTVILSASAFDMQMFERPAQENLLAGNGQRNRDIGPGNHSRHPADSGMIDSKLDSEALQTGLRRLPASMQAETAAACSLDTRWISEATLSKCYQARLAASADKNFRVWENLTRQLPASLDNSSNGLGDRPTEISPMMTASRSRQRLQQG